MEAAQSLEEGQVWLGAPGTQVEGRVVVIAARRGHTVAVQVLVPPARRPSRPQMHTRLSDTSLRQSYLFAGVISQMDRRGMDKPEVTLLTQDDRTIACTVERYPQLDRPEGHPKGQVTYYRAVPAERVELGTYEVQCSAPPHTAFFVDMPVGGLETIRPEAQA
jgi:hypothetical protein